jgi:hypothetical protein
LTENSLLLRGDCDHELLRTQLERPHIPRECCGFATNIKPFSRDSGLPNALFRRRGKPGERQSLRGTIALLLFNKTQPSTTDRTQTEVTAVHR